MDPVLPQHLFLLEIKVVTLDSGTICKISQNLLVGWEFWRHSVADKWQSGKIAKAAICRIRLQNQCTSLARVGIFPGG